MITWFLNPDTWDSCLDINGNPAVASAPYQPSQDVASAIKLFQGELWYNTTAGVPYFEDILGATSPPLSLISGLISTAALTVPEVVTANTVITSVQNRTVSGQVQFSTSTGVTASVGF